MKRVLSLLVLGILICPQTYAKVEVDLTQYKQVPMNGKGSGSCVDEVDYCSRHSNPQNSGAANEGLNDLYEKCEDAGGTDVDVYDFADQPKASCSQFNLVFAKVSYCTQIIRGICLIPISKQP